MNSSKHRVIFRADGDSNIGLGHVMRSLALVNMLNKEFDCLFLIRNPAGALLNTITTYCPYIAMNSAEPEDEYAELQDILTSSDILVVDGYKFNERYQQWVKSKVYKLVMIDDEVKMHFYADLIINHGSGDVSVRYSKEKYSKVLGGFKYALLREGFLHAAIKKREIEKIESAFICFGGADPYNITTKALSACMASDVISKVIVVTGSAFRFKNELLAHINSAGKEVTHKDLDVEGMISCIHKCEVAICPSSSIAMEVCCVKAGLLTGKVIENQSLIHDELIRLNCALTVNDFNAVSKNELVGYLTDMQDKVLINSLIKNQEQAIDGFSGERILKEFKALAA